MRRRRLAAATVCDRSHRTGTRPRNSRTRCTHRFARGRSRLPSAGFKPAETRGTRKKPTLEGLGPGEIFPLFLLLKPSPDHDFSIFLPKPCPPPALAHGAPAAGFSGCKLGGPPFGTYLSSQSSKAGPRGNRPGTMLQVSAFASMIVTFGSPEIGIKSFVDPPFTGPAEPK